VLDRFIWRLDIQPNPSASPGKHGNIKEREPKALTKLGLDPNHWSAKVKGIHWPWLLARGGGS